MGGWDSRGARTPGYRALIVDAVKLVADLATPRRLVEESRDYLVSKFGEPEPGWLAKPVTA